MSLCRSHAAPLVKIGRLPVLVIVGRRREIRLRSQKKRNKRKIGKTCTFAINQPMGS